MPAAATAEAAVLPFVNISNNSMHLNASISKFEIEFESSQSFYRRTTVLLQKGNRPYFMKAFTLKIKCICITFFEFQLSLIQVISFQENINHTIPFFCGGVGGCEQKRWFIMCKQDSSVNFILAFRTTKRIENKSKPKSHS